MNPVAQQYGALGVPGVNLLPPEIAARKVMRAVVAVSVMAVLAVVVLMALAIGGVLIAKSAATSERNTAVENEKAAVAARDAKLPIYQSVVEREAAEYTLAQIGLGEVNYASLLAAVQATQNEESSFEEIVFTGPNATELGGAEAEGEIYGSGVGTVTFKARTTSMETAIALVGRIEAVKGVANVRSTIEEYHVVGADTFYSVDGKGTLTSEALLMRLVPTSGLTNIDALLLTGPGSAEPSAAPAPSPEPTASAEEEG